MRGQGQKCGKMSYSMAASVQSLIHSISEPNLTVTKQISVASSLLTRTPALYPVSLDVLASAYQVYILQSEEGSGLAEALQEADKTIGLLLDYSPNTWSHRIMKWCIDVASYVSKRLTISSRSLEELLCYWLQNQKFKSVVLYIDRCIEYLVISGRGDECIDLLVRRYLTENMELNWLLTHILSLQPAVLVPKFLEKLLHLSISPSSPLFDCVAHVLDYVGHSYQPVVADSVMSVVERVISGDVGDRNRWSGQIEFLLKLAPLCGGLLSFTSQDCLKLVTAEKIIAIVVGSSSSGEGSQKMPLSSDEDEGEVKSDEETLVKMLQNRASRRGDVEDALVELLAVLQKETAIEALSQLLDIYSCLGAVADTQEETMEEGEICNVSLLSVVQESCWSILDQLQQKLFTTATETLTLGRRGGKGGVGDREFLVGLQCGLTHWSKMMLQPNLNLKCQNWLSVAVTSVSICSTELQAAKALATMLFYCQNSVHVVQVLEVYQQVNICFPLLAVVAVREALASCREETEACSLCENLWRITIATSFQKQLHFQSKFISALRLNMFPLSTLLLRLSREEREWLQVWRVLQMMRKVGRLGMSGGDYSTQCQVIGNLLSSFFCFTHTINDVIQDLCIGQCMALLAKWAGESRSLKIYLFKSVLKITMDKNDSDTGRREGREDAKQGNDDSLDHHLGLLQLVADGDGELVMSVILDMVAPHLPANSAHWLPGEGPRSAFLEWSLSVKKKFNQHPILWHLLLFSTHCGCNFCDCEPIVCSLLLVSTQHWFSCRYSGGLASDPELQTSVWLVEALAAAGWLPSPLAYSAEIFHSLSSNDLYLLMDTISNFIKINIEDLRRGGQPLLKEAVSLEVLKGVVVRNIHKLGNVYSHYVL